MGRSIHTSPGCAFWLRVGSSLYSRESSPLTRAWAARVASGLRFLVRGSPCSGSLISLVATDLPAPHVPLSAQPLLLSCSFFSRPFDFPVGSCFLSQIVRILNKFVRPTVKNCSFLCRSDVRFQFIGPSFSARGRLSPVALVLPPIGSFLACAPYCRACSPLVSHLFFCRPSLFPSGINTPVFLSVRAPFERWSL